MKHTMPVAEVQGIALDRESQLPIVLLKTSHPRRIIPIPVGPSEASAIIVEVEGVHPPRPLTHDLITELFQRHGMILLHCEIRDRIDDIYTAFIHYRRRFRNFSMEVRPSDAIALALRMKAPIRINPLLLAEAEHSLDVFRHLHGDDILLLEPDYTDHAV
ncbi:bifunctional nuclease family protein [Marispirochaeta sp.]|uniref:bifunctional nuclease family protein n=1 Tax=Marispirochaeta sp. TaxID=2038653 RepID=UPI0029C61A8A|nr:bifunctional nuclease family protein [Marispirochaeta sp.]